MKKKFLKKKKKKRVPAQAGIHSRSQVIKIIYIIK